MSISMWIAVGGYAGLGVWWLIMVVRQLRADVRHDREFREFLEEMRRK